MSEQEWPDEAVGIKWVEKNKALSKKQLYKVHRDLYGSIFFSISNNTEQKVDPQ